MRKHALGIYILILFVSITVSVLLATETVALYLSLMLFGVGFIAMAFQKYLHREGIKEMGLSLDKNVLAGLGILSIYFFIAFVLFYYIAINVGAVMISLNESSPLLTTTDPLLSVMEVVLLETPLMFLAALFGEELAWRGYVLPKMETRYGSLRAVLFSSVLFALWHIPVYFSLYTNGALAAGVLPLISSVLGHFISVIPLGLIYVKTRELYSLSLFHAVGDIMVYYVIGSPSFGAVSHGAVFNLIVLNPLTYEILGWAVYILSIVIVYLFYTQWNPLKVNQSELVAQSTDSHGSTSSVPAV